jgi:endonuclease/exonuclease/phosphatase family metal-dependent hydrolase
MLRIVSLVLLAACGGDGDPDPTATTGTDTPTGPGGSYTFTTYNAGLAVGFVPAADTRQPAIGPAIAELDTDVVCLQEVWLPEQVSAVAADTQAAFPHQYFPDPSQSSDAECLDGQLDGLIECMDEAGCSDACIDQIDECLFDNCGFDFLILPVDCMRCAMANVGSTPDEIVGACGSDPVEYAYGGSFGTGIVSKHPIQSTEELVFASTSNRRSALRAVLDTPDGEVTVYCTHLTAVFDLIPYPREEGDWEPEQRAQVEELLAWVDTSPTERVVVMGDMNTGPEVGDSNAEAPDNWALFAASDLSVPYLDDDPQCTYCAANPLLGGSSDNDDNRVIDHVMVKGFSAVEGSERVLDGDLPGVESCGDSFEPGALSDHYGVSTTVTW